MKKQAGFTLIELVIVIIILGILAVTAAPKFLNLQDDARTSTLKGVAGSLNSAGAMVYSKSVLKGKTKRALLTIWIWAMAKQFLHCLVTRSRPLLRCQLLLS